MTQRINRSLHWHWYLTRIVQDEDVVYRHLSYTCNCQVCETVRANWRQYLRWAEDGEGTPPDGPLRMTKTPLLHFPSEARDR